jgi:MinD-like ATPase involved in chromosome partitioning or flagellar assembly
MMEGRIVAIASGKGGVGKTWVRNHLGSRLRA